MALVINSNIQSLSAQRNLTVSQGDMNTAMERLSSGKRINTAADDAAGLAISSRMTSQIRGIDQAIRNANDGISMIQTAEGALQESTNILQRIRELSVQSANGIYGDGDRATLNAEAQQLISELQRISENTTFNGLTLLDGSQTDITLQAGADAGNTIDFSIKSVTTDTMGISTEGGVSAVGTDTALAQGDLIINGVTVGASKASDDTASYANADTSAIAKAAAINAVSDESGVTAIVDENVATGSGMTGAAGTGSVTINGTSFDITTSTDTAATRAALVESINAKALETGVTATDTGDDTQGITLTAADGRNITVSFSATTGTIDETSTGITAAGTYTGGYTLVADGNVSSIEISGSASLSANAGLSEGTYTAGESAVNSTAQVAAGSTSAVADATETSVVSFTALADGESVTIAGLTLTANGGALTADAVASAFASIADGATPADAGTLAYTGALTGYASGAATSNSVTFTATLTNQDVTDITYSTDAAAAGAPSAAVTTQGVTGVAEEFTATFAGFTELGGDTTMTFDGVTHTFGAATYTAAQTAADFVATYNADGGRTYNAVDNLDGTVTFTSIATGSRADVVAGDFVVVENSADTTSVSVTGVALDVDGVTEATEAGTVTFSDIASGDTITVDGLTFTASADWTGAQLASLFSNAAAGSTPTDPVGGAFTGALSANFQTGTATGASLAFTGAAPGDLTDLATSGVVAGGLTVTTTDGSTAAAAGTVNYANLDAGDLVINGTSIRAAGASDDTASYDGVISSSKEASGIAIAAAINDSSDVTGVTATVNATEVAGTTTTTSGTAGESATLTINGIDVTLTVQADAETSRTHAVDQINAVAGQTGVIAEDNGDGITLTAADGRNISLALDNNDAASTTTILASDFGLNSSNVGEADITGTAATTTETAATTYSTVSLTSASSIEVGAGSNGSAALAAIGFEVGEFGGAANGQYIKDVDISTVEGAEKAISAVDNALNQVADVRSQMGAVSNRLDFTINNLSSISTNTSAARSRIVDADFAAESAALSRAQVLQQAGTAMLAQANAQPQQVLSLLQ